VTKTDEPTRISRAGVDPDHDFLIIRHWGEPVVRFELPAATAAGATTVSLNGNFVRAPIQATRSGDSWIVERPMTEGRYTWLWQLGGPATTPPNDPSLTGMKTVKPLQPIANAYPGR
jgi:hypothetical protein